MSERQPHYCPVCGAESRIELDTASGSYMIHDGEFVGLTALVARLFCDCGWELSGMLDDVVFDVSAGTIKAGKFSPSN